MTGTEVVPTPPQPAPPPAPGVDAAASDGGRRAFDRALAAIFVPVLSLPVLWWMAVRRVAKARDGAARRWGIALVALALVDTLVAVALVAALQREGDTAPAAEERKDRVVIGVNPDLSYRGSGVLIRSVMPAGPAAAAGLRAGDVVLGIAGQKVASADALRAAVARQRAGATVPVEVARGARSLVVEVTPQWSARVPRPRPGFFEPTAGRDACVAPVPARSLVPIGATVGVLALLAAFVARRGGSARGVWWTALALVLASGATTAAYAGACFLLRGPTLAALVFALYGSPAAMIVTALAARGSTRAAQPPVATRSWAAAVRTGAWYLVTGELRIAVLLSPLLELLHGSATPSNPVGAVAEAAAVAAGPGLLLFAFGAIVLAPVGEELTFRGLLQPSLSQRMSPAAAVAITAVVFASMHWYYGVSIAVVAFAGAVLGWARQASGGLRAPIVLHALFNGAMLAPYAFRLLSGG